MNNENRFKNFLEENKFLVVIALFFIVKSTAGDALLFYIFPISAGDLSSSGRFIISTLLSVIIYAPFACIYFYFEHKKWKKKRVKHLETAEKIIILNKEFYITRADSPILFEWVSKNKELAPRLIEYALLDCYGSDIDKINGVLSILNDLQTISYYLTKLSAEKEGRNEKATV